MAEKNKYRYLPFYSILRKQNYSCFNIYKSYIVSIGHQQQPIAATEFYGER